MGQIFGDTDDITFGVGMPATRPSRTEDKSFSETRPTAVHRDSVRPPVSSTPRASFQSRPPLSDRPAHFTARPSRPAPARGPIAPPEKESPSMSLRRLVDSMKPSYLPETQSTDMRVVLFSPSDVQDPFMLIRSGDSSLLVGTGFSTLENAGISYQTFPDMRLAYSEKDRLSGWLLLTPGFDITSFQSILDLLGSPYIYATRDVIAYIRDSVKDPLFLEKCRFFELFALGTDERKIADLTLRTTSRGLSISVAGRAFVDTLHPIESSGASVGNIPCLVATESGYAFEERSVTLVPGEIALIESSKITKNALKFTFDTFYRDANSIGVVAGYALKDRVELASSGVLTFVIEEDPRARAIVGHIFIDSRGFVHSYEMMSVHKEVLKGIRHTYEQAILANPRIERGELVQTIRREITKYCYLITGRTPVVMPIIIER